MFQRIVATLFLIEGGAFLAAGWAPGTEQMVQSVLSRHPELFPADKLGELISFFTLLQRMALAFGAICFAGGWGAMQGQPWGRIVALVASVLNLLILTPLGIAGLFAFYKKTGTIQTEHGGTTSAERPEPVSHVLVMLASLALVVFLSHGIRTFAAGHGLPVNPNERLSFQWILLGQLVFTLIHELGHLLAAWAVGFRFHEINVGPFTLTERPGGSWAFRIEWSRILVSGGYLRSVPQTTKDLKVNWILVVVAGPAASLFLAMLGFLTLLSLAGTPYAEYWKWAAFVTAICTADCIANLLPLGLTDGALLFHTAVGTQRGNGILAGLEAAMLNDRADRSDGLMDPNELLETRRQALEQLQKSSESSGLAVAAQRIEFARASLRTGKAGDALAALQEAGKTLEALKDVPERVWFRYWVDMFEASTAMRQYTAAATARERGLAVGGKLAGEKMDWEELVPIQLDCARLWMSDGDYFTALTEIRETREAWPERRSVTAHAIELLAVEAECEICLGHRAEAETLAQAAADTAKELPEPQRAKAMELLAHTAVRLSAAGECDFAQLVFRAGVEGLEHTASPSVACGYRTAWAEALYESGKLAEAAAVLAPIPSESLGFALDVETLRAQLLLAEDRPQDAATLLTPLLMEEVSTEVPGARQSALARGRALRSWALYRSGSIDEALADARKACDILMPVESPDAAPALLTLAMAIASENADLAEAYLTEGTRLICDSEAFSSLTKASRLTDLARSVVQANRRDWAKQLMDQAAKFRGPVRKVSSPVSSIPTAPGR